MKYFTKSYFTQYTIFLTLMQVNTFYEAYYASGLAISFNPVIWTKRDVTR